jgi:hypothetical protein
MGRVACGHCISSYSSSGSSLPSRGAFIVVTCLCLHSLQRRGADVPAADHLRLHRERSARAPLPAAHPGTQRVSALLVEHSVDYSGHPAVLAGRRLCIPSVTDCAGYGPLCCRCATSRCRRGTAGGPSSCASTGNYYLSSCCGRLGISYSVGRVWNITA